MKTIVVSAFYECIKKPYSSSRFSILTLNMGKVKEDELGEYIKQILSNIGKVNFIFVSSDIAVRKALTQIGIDFYTVYPQSWLKSEWIGRLYLSGASDEMLKYMAGNFDTLTTDISEEPHGLKLFRLGHGEYIPIDHLYNLYGM